MWAFFRRTWSHRIQPNHNNVLLEFCGRVRASAYVMSWTGVVINRLIIIFAHILSVWACIWWFEFCMWPSTKLPSHDIGVWSMECNLRSWLFVVENQIPFFIGVSRNQWHQMKFLKIQIPKRFSIYSFPHLPWKPVISESQFLRVCMLRFFSFSFSLYNSVFQSFEMPARKGKQNSIFLVSHIPTKWILTYGKCWRRVMKTNSSKRH